MAGNLTKSCYLMLKHIEENYPNFDKTSYFTRRELEKFFFLTINKSTSYFRDVLICLEAFDILTKDDGMGKHYLNLEKYFEFKKFMAKESDLP